MKLEDIINQIEEADQLDPVARKAMRDKLIEMIKYVPRIGVFGKAGVGKSSLCNALFGDDVCAVDDIEACTRDAQDVILELGKDRRVILVDVPGVGESRQRDDEYRKLYRSLIPELDIILWVIKADDRSHTIDQDFYENVVRPELHGEVVTLFVLNQADKVEPSLEWDRDANLPGEGQLKNIQRKTEVVSKLFNVSVAQVIPVSATRGFRLTDLVDKMVMALPPLKRIATARVTRSDYVSSGTVKQVEKDVVSELNGAAIATGAVIGGVIGLVGGPVGVAIGAAIGGWIGSLFR